MNGPSGATLRLLTHAGAVVCMRLRLQYIRHNEHYVGVLPVMVHINYHPDKWERMKAVIDFYQNGKHEALEAFPDGESHSHHLA